MRAEDFMSWLSSMKTSCMAFELKKEIVIVIHEDLIRRGGEAFGIRDEGTIDYVLGKINGAADVFEKAAWALYMSRLHPFYDGNKRTAFVLAAMILRIYRFWIGKQDEEEIHLVLHKISNIDYECDVEDIQRWLKKKSRRWWATVQRTLYDYS